MSRYFSIRIELNNLNKKNDKVEYRNLWKALKKEGFVETFFDENDHEWKLPPGIYAIPYDESSSSALILTKTRTAIELALEEFYPSTWVSKYNITVFGLGPILGENLELVE